MASRSANNIERAEAALRDARVMMLLMLRRDERAKQGGLFMPEGDSDVPYDPTDVTSHTAVGRNRRPQGGAFGFTDDTFEGDPTFGETPDEFVTAEQEWTRKITSLEGERDYLRRQYRRLNKRRQKYFNSPRVSLIDAEMEAVTKRGLEVRDALLEAKETKAKIQTMKPGKKHPSFPAAEERGYTTTRKGKPWVLTSKDRYKVPRVREEILQQAERFLFPTRDGQKPLNFLLNKQFDKQLGKGTVKELRGAEAYINGYFGDAIKDLYRQHAPQEMIDLVKNIQAAKVREVIRLRYKAGNKQSVPKLAQALEELTGLGSIHPGNLKPIYKMETPIREKANLLISLAKKARKANNRLMKDTDPNFLRVGDPTWRESKAPVDAAGVPLPETSARAEPPLIPYERAVAKVYKEGSRMQQVARTLGIEGKEAAVHQMMAKMSLPLEDALNKAYKEPRIREAILGLVDFGAKGTPFFRDKTTKAQFAAMQDPIYGTKDKRILDIARNLYKKERVEKGLQVQPYTRAALDDLKIPQPGGLDVGGDPRRLSLRMTGPVEKPYSYQADPLTSDMAKHRMSPYQDQEIEKTIGKNKSSNLDYYRQQKADWQPNIFGYGPEHQVENAVAGMTAEVREKKWGPITRTLMQAGKPTTGRYTPEKGEAHHATGIPAEKFPQYSPSDLPPHTIPLFSEWPPPRVTEIAQGLTQEVGGKEKMAALYNRAQPKTPALGALTGLKAKGKPGPLPAQPAPRPTTHGRAPLPPAEINDYETRLMTQPRRDLRVRRVGPGEARGSLSNLGKAARWEGKSLALAAKVGSPLSTLSKILAKMAL